MLKNRVLGVTFSDFGVTFLGFCVTFSGSVTFGKNFRVTFKKNVTENVT